MVVGGVTPRPIFQDVSPSPSPEHWLRLQTLFAAALELPDAERARYVGERTTDDPALRQEVLSLLEVAATGRPDPNQGYVSDAAAAALDAGPMVGRRIGPFRIEREIGRGGMGAVYLGLRDGADFTQRVAVKVLPGGFASEELRRRFRAERRILAGLEHPRIAHLVDGGATPDGVPWVAMEYIDGEPITTHAAGRRLDLAARLRLMVAVAETVQHAHQRLIVHRDLKPSNILVDGGGIPHLIDFGIAKLLDVDPDSDHPETLTGVRLLTPAYASPEQIRGEPVTTAADVWSLGVVLYELVTGARPFAAASGDPRDTERAVLTDDPVRPSTAAGRSLPSDLDAILLTALRKEPARRYPSAAALADDLTRFLEGRPVTARAPTIGYRARRFVTRHRWAVGTAAVVAAVLAAGAVRLAGERARVLRERRSAEAALDFMNGLFSQLDPAVAGGSPMTVRELLDRGVVDLAAGEPDPAVLARLVASFAVAYNGLGMPDSAARLADAALEAATRSGEPSALARALAVRCRLEVHEARYREAIADCGAAARRWREAGEGSRMPRALADQARAYTGAGETDSAFAVAGRILALAGNRRDSAAGFAERAAANEREGRNGSALADLGRAWRLVRQDSLTDPAAVATYADNLAVTYRLRATNVDSLLYYRAAALRLTRRIYPPGHPSLVDPLLRSAYQLMAVQRWDEAGALVGEARRIADSALGPESRAAGQAWLATATIAQAGNDFDRAIPLTERAIAILARHLSPDARSLTAAESNLAIMYEARGRYADAERRLRHVVSVYERDRNPNQSRMGLALNALGLVERRLGRRLAAESTLVRSVRVLERAEGDSTAVRYPLEHLAGLYEETGRDAPAAERYGRALALAMTSPAGSGDAPGLAEKLAAVLRRLGRADSAARLAAWIERSRRSPDQP